MSLTTSSHKRVARNDLVFYLQSWEKDEGEEWFVDSTKLSKIISVSDQHCDMNTCRWEFLTDIQANWTTNEVELGNIQIIYYPQSWLCEVQNPESKL